MTQYFIKYILLLFLAICSFFGFGQNKFLDSTIYTELNARISDKGKNPVYNYQLYFNYNDKYIFNGALGVNKKGDSIIPKNYKFKSASTAKTFIAIMVLQIEEEGLIDINKPIINYLDSSVISKLKTYKKVDLSHEITVKNLLNHTAGLADYILDDRRFLLGTYYNPKREFTPIDHLKRYKKHNLNNKTSSSFGTFYYSDTHYLLLGLLIEKITGISLQKNLNKRICQPINLKTTYVDTWDSCYTNIMHQYLHQRDITNSLHPSFEFGGGGLITTVQDLGLFIKALFDNKLFTKPATLSKMIKINESHTYGLGIMKKEIPGNWITKNGKDSLIAYGHDGYFGIEMYHIPKKNITWIISKGQGYKNKHVNNIPIWLTIIRFCESNN